MILGNQTQDNLFIQTFTLAKFFCINSLSPAPQHCVFQQASVPSFPNTPNLAAWFEVLVCAKKVNPYHVKTVSNYSWSKGILDLCWHESLGNNDTFRMGIDNNCLLWSFSILLHKTDSTPLRTNALMYTVSLAETWDWWVKDQGFFHLRQCSLGPHILVRSMDIDGW